MDKEELTTTEAAKRLGVSSGRAIARYCKLGKIPGAIRRLGRWYIPVSALEDLK